MACGAAGDAQDREGVDAAQWLPWVRIEWDSQDGHIKGFRTSPEFQTFYEAVRPFFNDIEEMRHYEVTYVSGK